MRKSPIIGFFFLFWLLDTAHFHFFSFIFFILIDIFSKIDNEEDTFIQLFLTNLAKDIVVQKKQEKNAKCILFLFFCYIMYEMLILACLPCVRRL